MNEIIFPTTTEVNSMDAFLDMDTYSDGTHDLSLNIENIAERENNIVISEKGW